MEPKILINFIKAAVFAALLTPFVKDMHFYFPFVGPKGIYFMAVAEAAFFAWIVLAWRWKQYRPNFKNPAIIVILLFLAISFIAAIFGADFSASFWSKFERMGGVLMFLHLGAFAIAAASVFEANDWRRLFAASVGLSAIIAVQALFDQSAQSRGGGFIGNDSFWATYVLFNIFIALYLFLSSTAAAQKKMKIFSGAVFLTMAFCLFFEGTKIWRDFTGGNFNVSDGDWIFSMINSGARAAKISFLAGMALLGVLWLATCQKIAVRIFGIAVLCMSVLAGIGLIFLATNPGNVVYEKMTDKFSEGTIHGRVVVWEIAWKGFLERPLLGWGPENFNLVFSRHYNPCFGTPECSGETWFDRAHNIVFDTLVEVGAIGLLGYLLIFVASFYILWKGYCAKTIGFAEAGTFTALFCAYFLQNLTVFDMVVSYVMWFMCLGFIAWVYDSGRRKEIAWPQPLEWRQVLPPGIATVVCLCVFVLGPMTGDYDTVQAVSAPYGSSQRIQLYRDALNASPLGKYQIRMFFAAQWRQVALNKEIYTALTPKQLEDNFVFIADELEKTRRESPFDFQSRLELGRLYNVWSLFDKTKIGLAQAVLEEAKKLAPDNQQSYWELAQNLVYQSRIDEAESQARQAYDLYPGNPNAAVIIEEINKIKTGAGGESEQ